MHRPLRLAGVLVALSPAVSLSFAAPAPVAQEAAPTEKNDEARAKKRILHLTNGGAMRGIARLVDGAWEVKRGSNWMRVPAALVERTALEREVLDDWKSQIKNARKADDVSEARAATVRWGFEAGIYQEALEAAEVLLRDEPKNLAARHAVTDHAHLLGVPAVPPAEDGAPNFEAHFSWASQRGRALREAALIELGRASIPARDQLREALAEQLGHVLPDRRSYAALAMGRLYPGEGVRPLLVHALRDAAGNVRAEAGRALGQAGEPGLVLPLVKVLEDSASPRMRRQAAEALGHMGYRTAVQPLVGRLSAIAKAPSAAQSARSGRVPHRHIFVGRQFAFIQDFDVEVAQLQSVADPQVNVLIEGDVLDVGVVGTREYRRMISNERTTIQRALGGITGEDPGDFARDWIAWWEKQKAAEEAAAGDGTAAVQRADGDER